MRWLGRWLGGALLGALLVMIGSWAFGRRDGVGPIPAFHAALIGADVDAWLARREAVFDDLTPGTQKRVIWVGKPGEKTRLSIVYLHGFSATSEEIRPVPDRVAKALGANLYFTRLTGHGRDGAALAAATPEDWFGDLAETLAVGQRIGDRVVVIATSTGGTLAALGAIDPVLSKQMAGVVLISPNFGMADRVLQAVLDFPFMQIWGPVLAGREQVFRPVNASHARFWTTRYPTKALMPMAAVVRDARGQDYGVAHLPALFLYSQLDRVVSARKTASVAADWGGPVAVHVMAPQPGDDAYAHVLAGDILSPGGTARITAQIIAWITTLPDL